MGKAWICTALTGVEGLVWREFTAPDPGVGEVRVAIGAASLNFPDLLIIEGKYQFKPPLPFVPGTEFAGTVEAVGPKVDGFRIGDRVAGCPGTGGFATHATVPAGSLTRVPNEIGLPEAAALTLTYGTAHHALFDRAGLRAGETVLVLGAAGGVGSAAVQLAKVRGARVIAGVSSPAKAAFCISSGADATIDYSREHLRDRIKALTNGIGPDVIYDPVGGALAEPAFRSIGWRGRYLVIGFAEGSIPALPLNLPLLKGASIVGVFWGDHCRREPAAHRAAMTELVGWCQTGKLTPVINRTFPIAELPAGYRRMAAREAMGKIVVVP